MELLLRSSKLLTGGRVARYAVAGRGRMEINPTYLAVSCSVCFTFDGGRFLDRTSLDGGMAARAVAVA